MIKKVFFTILVLTVVFAPKAWAYDFSAKCESGQTLFYKITSNAEPYKVTVTYEKEGNEANGWAYYSTKPSGNLDIPESVTYNNITYSVTAIGESTFYDCSGLTGVTIPNTIKTIGEYAFGKCSGITSVVIPESITKMEKYVFWFCTGLTSVKFPNYISSFEEGAFFSCTSLTSVKIPEYSNIGIGAFGYCTNLTSVIIPESVRKIENLAFACCHNLTSVTIPKKIRKIGDYAFSNCPKLDKKIVKKIKGKNKYAVGWYDDLEEEPTQQ